MNISRCWFYFSNACPFEACRFLVAWVQVRRVLASESVAIVVFNSWTLSQSYMVILDQGVRFVMGAVCPFAGVGASY